MLNEVVLISGFCLCFSALPVRAGDQDAGATQPLLHAAPVPAVSRPQ